MKIELIISSILGFIIVILGMYFCYKRAYKDRLSKVKEGLIIPLYVTLFLISAFGLVGLIGQLTSFSNRDKIWYLYFLIIISFFLNLIFTWLGYRERTEIKEVDWDSIKIRKGMEKIKKQAEFYQTQKIVDSKKLNDTFTI